jgi:hypothetical protein
MRTNFIFLLAIILCAPLHALELKTVTASVVSTSDEDLVGEKLVLEADLSAFEEDMSGISRIFLAKGTRRIELSDRGEAGDTTRGDLVYTAANIGFENHSLNETITLLTTGPFVFELLSDFDANPPLPDSINIQKLTVPDDQGNTLRITADMTPSAAIVGGVKVLNISMGDTKIKFRDDGLRNDVKSGDLTFTASLNMSTEEVKKFAASHAAAAKIQGGIKTVFSGRSSSLVPIKAFDSVAFNQGKVTPLISINPRVVNASTLPVIREKSLVVRDVSVVEDLTRTYDHMRKTRGNREGAWTFGKLMAGVAGVSSPEDSLQFAIDWVDSKVFASGSNVFSGDSSAERAKAKEIFVKAWLANSGVPVPKTAGVPADWKNKSLKMWAFPVRLLAIVNRLDLRGNLAHGLSNTGEGRFVFCFVDSNMKGAFGATATGLGAMTLIFEYGLPFQDCDALESYVNAWWDMQKKPWGAAFNQSLENITTQFTASGTSPEKSNGSSLNHLRTNEFLQVTGWQIRDFLVADGRLEHTWDQAPGAEPGAIWNGPAAGTPLLPQLVAFVNAIPFATQKSIPPIQVPEALTAFAAPMPPIKGGKLDGVLWRGSSVNPMKPLNRREFSLLTCTGCHTRETSTFFTHVKPRPAGTKAALSAFLSGPIESQPMMLSVVSDPLAVGNLPPKKFNDILRRALDLADLVQNFKCVPTDPLNEIPARIGYPPLGFSH